MGRRWIRPSRCRSCSSVPIAIARGSSPPRRLGALPGSHPGRADASRLHVRLGKPAPPRPPRHRDRAKPIGVVCAGVRSSKSCWAARALIQVYLDRRRSRSSLDSSRVRRSRSSRVVSLAVERVASPGSTIARRASRFGWTCSTVDVRRWVRIRDEHPTEPRPRSHHRAGRAE